eukprot:5283690-Amphidinium_carterae.1
MTLQELRAKVREEEQRIEANRGGAYISPPIPNLDSYSSTKIGLKNLKNELKKKKKIDATNYEQKNDVYKH